MTGLELPPRVRAQIELLRARARVGLELTCGGVSMEPVIARGDRVRVCPGRPGQGEIAAFVTAGGLLELHRLIARGPGGWWVHAGDNQAAPVLGLVHDRQIVGVVARRRRAVPPVQRARAVLRLALAAARRAGQR